MYILPINSITNTTYFTKQNKPNFKAVSIPKQITTKPALEAYLAECRQKIAALNPKELSSIEEELTHALRKMEAEFSKRMCDTLKGIKKKWWETNESYWKRRDNIINPIEEEKQQKRLNIIQNATTKMSVRQNENEANEVKIKLIEADMKSAETLFYRTEINKKQNEIDSYKYGRAKYLKNKGFDKIAGYSEEKNLLYKYFISEIRKERKGEEANIPSSILFFGPRGMGKSTFYKAFAEETECKVEKIPLNIIKGDIILNNDEYCYLLNQIYKIADKAKSHFEETNIRTILFIDELTKLASKNSPILKELNEFLATCSEKYHCTVFGATNYPEQLGLNFEDNNIFPYRVALEPPTLEDKAKILEFYLRDRYGSNIDYSQLAKILEKIEEAQEKLFSINRIKFICQDFKATENIEQEFCSVIEEDNQKLPNISKEQLDLYSQNFTRLMNNEV